MTKYFYRKTIKEWTDQDDRTHKLTESEPFGNTVLPDFFYKWKQALEEKGKEEADKVLDDVVYKP